MEGDVLAESQLEYEDQDSLFGSPPPSPRGRSPSPTLALPSHGNSLNDRQNVGTIALPGSQSYSKLPMNPLALSLSLPQASQLPAQGCSNPTAAQASTSQEPQKRTADASAGQMKSSGTYCSTRQKKKNAQSKSKESTPRPEITLPDPSVPPPANFLRNQSALLGTAGLVGGVRPSKLSTNRYTCGATPSNPIVVDDEDEPSAIGRSRYRTGMNQSIDPSRLPAPSNQDIVAMLIGQKDIFPVLESILKLIANGATSTPRLTGFERKSASERPQQNVNGTGTSPSSTDKPPPLKRRKLSRVPAGAADWDVPYPFPQGEGPEEYRQNWERERGKQLIAQLVNLIKIAARKAAMKNYLQKEENKKKHEEERKKLRELDERRRIETREATMEASSSEILLDKSNELLGSSSERSLKNSTAPASRASPAISVATSGASTPYSFCATSLQQSGYSQLPHLPSEQQRQMQSTAAFDQLISSLLSASPAHDISSGNMQNSIASSNSAPLSRLSTSVDSSGSITPVDQTLFDSWMSVLQAFPVPSGGFQQTQEQSSIADSSISTTSFVDGDVGFDFTGMDFNMEGTNNAIPDFDAMMAPLSDTSQPQPSLTPMNSDQCSININSSTSTELPSPCLLDINHLIDPTLLAISTHQPEPTKLRTSSVKALG
ncbi:hypothetical protein BDQ17DRAFT_466613 [Cyathus striatus]|nr:hypothetical protein BDQ17DRAFT_466613 [Cyathus striatus]